MILIKYGGAMSLDQYVEHILYFFPSLKDRNYICKSGADNDVILIDDYVFRFPKKKGDRRIILEKEYLDIIGNHITTNIPKISIHNYVDNVFSSHNLINGIVLKDYNGDYDKIAKQIVVFLCELHSVKITNLKVIKLQDWYRDRIKENFDVIKDYLIATKVKCTFESDIEEYFNNVFDYESVVVHNDLHNENIIVDSESGQLNGVIDFTDIVFSDYHSDFVFLYKDLPTKIFDKITNEYASLSKRPIDKEYIALAAKIFIYKEIGQKNEEQKNAYHLNENLIRILET
ncbi:MAG: aminoglycoside phosphotransferase family protein [Rickettsiales bacterium]|nr:aminoglycoside phosphotransferase family protein [Rickettsiales bacterium]